MRARTNTSGNVLKFPEQTPVEEPLGRREWLPAALHHILLLVGFALVAVAFTWPLAANLSGSVILARGGDAWLHLWDLWWVKEALTNLGQTPFYTTHLYYPTGVSLYYHSLDTVNALLSIPLQGILGLVASFNILLLASVALSGYAAYLLIREVTGNTAASIAGALVFALSPIQSTSVELGQLDQVSMQWIPLYLLFLIRSARRGWWPNVPLAGLFFALASLATWYFAMTLVIVTVLFVVYEILTDRTWNRIKQTVYHTAGIVAVSLVLMSPMLVPMLMERAQGGQYMVPAFGTTVYNSADLVEFFLPARGVDMSTEYNHGANVAIGYVPLLLGITGATLAWKKARFWVLTAGILFVLALGPLLRVAGNQTEIPLPYYLLYLIPGAAISRQPLRFDAVLMLALGVLVALGLVAIGSRLQGHRTPLGRWALPALWALLIVFEFALVPRPMGDLGINGFYRDIAQEQGDFALLEVPSSVLARSMYEQTVHGKSIIGGYTSRHFPYPFSEETPGVRQIFLPDPASLEDDIFRPKAPDVAQDVMAFYGIKYVVLHKQAQPQSKVEETRRSINAIFGNRGPDFRDKELAVWKVTPAGTSRIGIGIGDGWHKMERDGARTWRWTNGDASLNVVSLEAKEAEFQLDFTAHSFYRERTLDVYLNGTPIATEKIGLDLKPVSLKISLQPGANSIKLVSREPSETPTSLGMAKDDRPLALGFSDIRVSPATD